ncbi:hypothetical protein TNCV_4735151 [Trichonephila clavipes]|nr:hypothetical protein TNCV_4735151 [Trichonephila clavipes]
MPFYGPGTMTMIPRLASNSALCGQRYSCCCTRVRNCTSCNLLRMAWVDTHPSVPRGNRLRMSRAVEKGSRIINWRIPQSVHSNVHHFLFGMHVDLPESIP